MIHPWSSRINSWNIFISHTFLFPTFGFQDKKQKTTKILMRLQYCGVLSLFWHGRSSFASCHTVRAEPSQNTATTHEHPRGSLICVPCRMRHARTPSCSKHSYAVITHRLETSIAPFPLSSIKATTVRHTFVFKRVAETKREVVFSRGEVSMYSPALLPSLPRSYGFVQAFKKILISTSRLTKKIFNSSLLGLLFLFFLGTRSRIAHYDSLSNCTHVVHQRRGLKVCSQHHANSAGYQRDSLNFHFILFMTLLLNILTFAALLSN